MISMPRQGRKRKNGYEALDKIGIDHFGHLVRRFDLGIMEISC